MNALAPLGLLIPIAAFTQVQRPHLPTASVVKGDTQAYRVVCDYYYLDAKGELARRERISALYSRNFVQNSVRWTNVAFAESNGASENFKPAQPREFMEGFRYSRSNLKDMLKPAFFQDFPATAMLERTLIWDTHMIESFGQDYWAHLTPEGVFHVPQSDVLSIAGAGVFKLKDLQLTWTGISGRSGQECAIIDYRAFLNTVEMNLPAIHLTAGSNFWGQVWVSLNTKRIEYGTVYESVVGELRAQGQEDTRIINIFRTGLFEPRKQ